MQKRPLRRWLFHGTLVGLFCLSFLWSQGTPPEKKEDQSAPTTTLPQPTPPASDAQPGFKIGVEVNMVSLPVSARLASGGFAKGIPQEAFHVYEDGMEQEIVMFQQESVPVHVVLMIDCSGSVQTEWRPIKHAARRFAEALTKEDRISVIAFNTQTKLVVDWTEDGPALTEKALNRILPKGNTALFDALYVVFDDLFKGVTGKKAVILLTDGFDNTSQVTYEQALDLATRSEALIYAVSKTQALRNTLEFYQSQYGNMNIDPMDFAAADSMLKHLTFQTGGRVLYPGTFGELGNVYLEVAQELANQYAVGYVPYNALKDGKYRNVRVTVDRAEVRISTRPGYYAPLGKGK